MMLRDDEELFDIKGDPQLPGVGLQFDLSQNKIEVPVRYRDRLTWLDVYRMGDYILVHLYCPRCEQCLKVENEQKRMRLNLGERRIDIGAFKCTHPGCGWSVEIVGNVATDV